MTILDRIHWFVRSLVITAIVTVVVLVLLRLIANKADLNPFGKASLSIRRLTDPLIGPVRRALMGFGADPKYAPIVAILITILLGFLSLQLLSSMVFTITGVWQSAGNHAVVPIIGYVLYGLLSFYSLLIFVRIVFSWVMVGYSNRVMRFVIKATEPLLGPLRRLIPAVGPFDISAMVALLIVGLFQSAIAGTLLTG